MHGFFFRLQVLLRFSVDLLCDPVRLQIYLGFPRGASSIDPLVVCVLLSVSILTIALASVHYNLSCIFDLSRVHGLLVCLP